MLIGPKAEKNLSPLPRQPYGLASSLPQPLTAGAWPSWMTCHTRELSWVNTGLPYSSSSVGTAASGRQAPLGRNSPAASDAFRIASRPSRWAAQDGS